MLDGYYDSELTGARVASSKMGFFTKEPESEEGFTGDSVDENDNPIIELEAGTFKELPTGWKFQSFDPQSPTTSFEMFSKLPVF